MIKAGWLPTALFAPFMVGASVLPECLEAAPAVVLSILPGTGLPGAILMTGLPGGAIASQLRDRRLRGDFGTGGGTP